MIKRMSQHCLIHWFRNDLRLHDMPSLSCALKECSTLYPIYIFDEKEIKEDKIGYNRLVFILEALRDIDKKLQLYGGRLYVFCGDTLKILSNLIKIWSITHISYEDDIQPIWVDTELHVQQLCEENKVQIIKRVSHTMWDPREILKANRGQPPVTYDIFCLVSNSIGPPPKPEPALNLQNVLLPNRDVENSKIPEKPEDLGVAAKCNEQNNKVWTGGETAALCQLENRLKMEKKAAADGILLPTQAQPDLLAPSISMSAALSMGCLSVRKFYYSLLDIHGEENMDSFNRDCLLGQLFWREYFYAMCMNNPYYGQISENPICLSIAWEENPYFLQCWKDGKTGFPFIDAAIRQMHQEGWIHHVARNAIACFLTRGDLWISWEEGFKVFMKYMIDADFAVCAGNWMWVSSSAFENILQCVTCISPVLYGMRFDRSREYIKKYIPELRCMPSEYVFEPWLAPLSVQETIGCIIGKDYPYPIVDHDEVAERNTEKMDSIKERLVAKNIPFHCTPSNSEETRMFMWLPENCLVKSLEGI